MCECVSFVNLHSYAFLTEKKEQPRVSTVPRLQAIFNLLKNGQNNKKKNNKTTKTKNNNNKNKIG